MRDATHYRPLAPHVPTSRGAERVARAVDELGRPRFWIAPVPVEEALASGMTASSAAVRVEGNHGRWVVVCPACRDAQLADTVDRRFMCHHCANASVNGLWRPVLWPRDHREIAAALDERPNMADRNWIPGETAEDIREQNKLLSGAVMLVEQHVQLQGAEYPDGHVHLWPESVKPEVIYSCEGCGARYDGAAIQGEREGKS